MYAILIRYWVVFKTYEQVTVTGTVHQMDTLLGDKPGLKIIKSNRN